MNVREATPGLATPRNAYCVQLGQEILEGTLGGSSQLGSGMGSPRDTSKVKTLAIRLSPVLSELTRFRLTTHLPGRAVWQRRFQESSTASLVDEGDDASVDLGPRRYRVEVSAVANQPMAQIALIVRVIDRSAADRVQV